jgi:hypothetical protein
MFDWSQAQVEAAAIAGIISIIVALATVAAGVWRSWAEQRQANKRPFLEKQLGLCFEAVEAVGRLATETDPGEWEKARLNFWRLYWGALCIVEDDAVENAMVALGELVPAKPKPDVLPILPMASLQMPSLALAHAARDLVLRSWNIKMPSLQTRTQ